VKRLDRRILSGSPRSPLISMTGSPMTRGRRTGSGSSFAGMWRVRGRLGGAGADGAPGAEASQCLLTLCECGRAGGNASWPPAPGTGQQGCITVMLEG
jgi:hypothetical protein